MAGFAIDVAEWVKKTKDNFDEATRAIAIGLLRSIVLKSPVGDPDLWKSKPPPGYVGGRFRGNWQVTIGVEAEGMLDLIDPSGGQAISAGINELADFKAGPPIFIVNNLPYAHRLEYEGWSTQAPQGMVGITVVEFQQIVNAEVSQIK